MIEKIKYKVLNLYAGIGGNRKHWDNCQVTAVELNPEIAAIYQDFYPDDIVIVADAHQYLLDHFKEFDFIWSSPPCPTHSKLSPSTLKGNGFIRYPDMKLYEEIIFLMHFYEGYFTVENVISYYNPLILPVILGHHYFWSNFNIKYIKVEDKTIGLKESKANEIKMTEKILGYDLSKYKFNEVNQKRTVLRNCVNSELGLAIFNRARNIQIEETIPQGKLNFKL